MWWMLGVAFAADPVAVPAEGWLLLGPVAAPAPAFSEAGPAAALGSLGLELDGRWPVAGDVVDWPGTRSETWREVRAGRRGVTVQGSGEREVAWLATDLRADRYAVVTVSLAGDHPARVWLDGTSVLEASGKDAKEPAKGELKLTAGDHLLVVHTARDPEAKGAWVVAPTLEVAPADAGAVQVGPRPTRRLAIPDLLDTPAFDGVSVARDGGHLLVSWRRPEVPADDAEHWTEVRRSSDGQAVAVLAGGEGQVEWLPDGRRYSFVTTAGEKSTLWVAGLDGGAERVLTGVEDLSGVWWLPDGRVVVSVREEPEKDETGIKRMRSTADRWPETRIPEHLWVGSARDGTLRRLTSGDRTASVLDVHPTLPKLLVALDEHDTAERPYSRRSVVELDVPTGRTTPLFEDVTTLEAVLWAPDGARMVLVAGPSFLGGLGSTLPAGVLPNDFDTELYLRDADGNVVPLSRDFAPSVGQVAFGPGGDLFLTATAGERTRLYRYGLDRREGQARPASSGSEGGGFADLQAPADSAQAFGVARDAELVAVVASSTTSPPALWSSGAAGGWKEVVRPGAERYARVAFGEVKPFAFTSTAGREILGHVVFPPEFDPGKRYPVIVDYYGGTSPIERSFGGRYPTALWAAHGYLVYVIQPSGAVGLGQERSALHVGTWGRDGVQEIIEGTKAFLAATPQADPARVGCIGASYGGFMTMSTISHTDLFRAAVAHAGISSLSSYWGEGWWGHTYSAVASGESLPWNDRALYVEQSPLFRADHIHTPLLLSHGTEDTNVPIGESESMYTALRVLGREVEFVQIEGEGHWVLTYPKRVRWMMTILAWFDRELKDQPAWWEALYGTAEASR